MKRLALILTVFLLLIPSQVFAQGLGAGAFMDGFARGMAMSRGQYVPPPPPVCQPPPAYYLPPAPQSGFITGPNGLYIYQMNPGGTSGNIYGPNGQTYTIQGIQ